MFESFVTMVLALCEGWGEEQSSRGEQGSLSGLQGGVQLLRIVAAEVPLANILGLLGGRGVIGSFVSSSD